MPLNAVSRIIGTGIQAAANYGIAKYNNEEAAKREKAARQENYVYGEKAADAADARTRALYSDLYSPEAQMQQIKEAGLSPAIYGGNGQGISGKGGVSGAQGSGASGVNPQVFGMSPMDISQIELNQALTNKADAEADNTKQDTILKQQQTTQQELANYITEKSANFNIQQAEELARMYKMQAELTATKNKRENIFLQYDDEKTKAEINEMKERTNNIIVDTGLKIAQQNLANSQISLNAKQEQALQQQIRASIDATRQKWVELDIAGRNQEQQKVWLERQAENLINMYNAKCRELDLTEAKIENEDARAYERIMLDMYLGDKESFSSSFGNMYTSTSNSSSGLSKDAKKGLKKIVIKEPYKRK